MEEIQKLLDSTLPFVADLLKKHGEFYPLAAAIKIDGTIAQIGTYDGNENPISETLIADLKNVIRTKKEEYKVIAIFYDVRLIKPNTNIMSDAIAVFIEAKSENKSSIFYYPYQLTDSKNLIFSDSWRDEIKREIY